MADEEDTSRVKSAPSRSETISDVLAAGGAPASLSKDCKGEGGTAADASCTYNSATNNANERGCPIVDCLETTKNGLIQYLSCFPRPRWIDGTECDLAEINQRLRAIATGPRITGTKGHALMQRRGSSTSLRRHPLSLSLFLSLCPPSLLSLPTFSPPCLSTCSSCVSL